MCLQAGQEDWQLRSHLAGVLDDGEDRLVGGQHVVVGSQELDRLVERSLAVLPADGVHAQVRELLSHGRREQAQEVELRYARVVVELGEVRRGKS